MNTDLPLVAISMCLLFPMTALGEESRPFTLYPPDLEVLKRNESPGPGEGTAAADQGVANGHLRLPRSTLGTASEGRQPMDFYIGDNCDYVPSSPSV